MNMLLLSILLMKSYTQYDPGCSEDLPKRCPNDLEGNIICKTDYTMCDGFEGCNQTSHPYLCSNGQCAENFFNCQEKYFTCTSTSLQKCQDGICRESCNLIKSSACSFDRALRCPNGECVESKVRCASSRCSPDQPFLCPNGTCRGSFKSCEYKQNIRIGQ